MDRSFVFYMGGMSMGYKIEYGNRGRMRFCKPARKPLPKWCVAAGCLALVLAAAAFGWQSEQVMEFLLPGDAAVTAAALQPLLSELRSGEGLREAVTAFCTEILENSQAIV